MRIAPLADHPEAVPVLAAWHFAEWGAASPGATLDGWTARLATWTSATTIPTAFVALADDAARTPLGSAALIAHDMDTRPDLTPWLAFVYVAPVGRRRGVGSALVRRAMAHAAALRLPALYLYTERAEAWYRGFGWRPFGREHFEGAEVTLMRWTPARGE